MGVRSFQTMVPMRDGARLNTFVFLPESGGPRFPVILHRTPYGIAAADARDKFDHTNAWLPSAAEPMRGSILRGWKNIVARGYVAVYQDCRGRHGLEGEDRVYADDAADGYDTLDWIAGQDWCNQRVGISGSSAGAVTTFAAASTRHPSLRAFFAQAGASSIYDDVIYEGQGIEMERLWLWVAKNIPGLSKSHREAVLARFGLSAAELESGGVSAAAGSFTASGRRPPGRWRSSVSRPGSISRVRQRASCSIISGRRALIITGPRAASTSGPSAPTGDANPLAPRTRFPPIFSPTKPRRMHFGKLPGRSGHIARAPAFAAALSLLR